MYYNLGGFTPGFSGLLDFKFRGVQLGYPKFSSLQAAKLFVVGKNVSEMQERYGPPLSPCQVWWGSAIARRPGTKKFDVSFCLFAFCFFVYHAF